MYLEAIYFTLCTMAMGGFGDFMPMNTSEQFAAMALLSVNYCLLLYVIGVMTNTVTAFSVKTRAFQKEFRTLQLVRVAMPCKQLLPPPVTAARWWAPTPLTLKADPPCPPTKPNPTPPQYLDAHQLPEEICDELRLFLKLKFQRRREHAEVVEAFPPLFRARLFRIMYRPVIEKSYLLKGATDTFVDLLSCELIVHLFQTVRSHETNDAFRSCLVARIHQRREHAPTTNPAV